MPEPKTVRDRYDYTDPIPEEDGRAEGECWCFYPKNPVLDYHIIPGADVVVTAEGLEDAAKDVYLTGWRRFADDVPVPWCEVEEELRRKRNEVE